MRLFLVQLDLFLKLACLSIHPHARKPVCLRLCQDILERAFSVARQGGQHLKALSGRQRGHPFHDLLRGLGVHLATAARAMRRADTSKEHPQIVIDLGHSRHSRARVLAHGLLFNGDRRAQPPDKVHLGFFHLADELPGVGGERFDVATLSLRVQCVKGQRRLAAARHAGDHHQLEARQLNVDIPQVILFGAPDDNPVLVHTRDTPLRSSDTRNRRPKVNRLR